MLTIWQKVIFRNYGVVEDHLIGKVIGLNENKVVFHAIKMGLSHLRYNSIWKANGFVSIIRKKLRFISE